MSDNIDNRDYKRRNLTTFRVYFMRIPIKDESNITRRIEWFALGTLDTFTPIEGDFANYDRVLNIDLPEHMDTEGLTAIQLKRYVNKVREGIKCPSCSDFALIDPACGKRCENCCKAYC